MAVYDDMMARVSLLPQDRESLRTMRGFTDEVIDTYLLRSCGQHAAAAVSELRNVYSSEQLLEAKLLTERKGQLLPNAQISNSNILIPYINQDGTVRKIRPHKLGFAGDSPQVYRTRSSYGQGPVCIVTESEFKAIAAECFGYPAIGIPGISSMGGENLNTFVDTVKTMAFSEFVICFDNEIKSDPALPNFKPRWKDRYDTIIWAYIMARHLISAGKVVRVATLPAAWMDKGKIDIDTALAQGRAPEQFAAVVSDAQPPEEYLAKAPIPDVHRWYVNRRVRNALFRTPITIQNNCYFAAGKNGDVRLTNFTMTVRRTYTGVVYDPRLPEMDRLISLKDMYGIESRPAFMPVDCLASRGNTQRWIGKMGNFLLYGKDEMMPFIWDYVFNMDDSDTVHRITESGYLPQLDMWVFKNLIVKGSEVYHPDEAGIFHVDDVSYCVELPRADSAPLATLPFNPSVQFDIARFRQCLRETVDLTDAGMGDAMLSWFLASFFTHAIVKRFKSFPLLFFYGNKTGGKTTIINWLQSFLGMQEMNFNLKTASMIGVARAMQAFHGVPVAVDDWRNVKEFNHYIEFFLGVYNRQRGLKATVRPGEMYVTNVNATLAITGEELIMDGGVLSRCLVFYLPQQELRRVNHLEEMSSMAENAGAFSMEILKNYASYTERVVAAIEQAIKDLSGSVPAGTPYRRVLNHAVALGAFRAIIGGDDTALRGYCIWQMNDLKSPSAVGDLDRVQAFTEELVSVDTAGLLPAGCFMVDRGRFTVAMRVACDAINRYYHRQENTAPLLMKLMSSQDYFIEFSEQEIGGRKLPVVVLDMTRMPREMAINVNALGRSISLEAV